jgi:hypothetical protein
LVRTRYADGGGWQSFCSRSGIGDFIANLRTIHAGDKREDASSNKVSGQLQPVWLKDFCKLRRGVELSELVMGTFFSLNRTQRRSDFGVTSNTVWSQPPSWGNYFTIFLGQAAAHLRMR